MHFVDAALVVELTLIIGIILFIPYTEIDWTAYMEEVRGFLGGELDYRELKGGTGPLVYPGGFVWLYGALYYITKLGTDIQLAQWIFGGLYWATLALILCMYRRANLEWKIMIPLFISKRIRSLFMLRLFNDCWAMFVLFLAIATIAGRRQWRLGCILFSIAVSIKMNVLLFAPGLFYVMLRSLPLMKVVELLTICAVVQVAAGFPFLVYDPVAYISKGFELGRVFTFRWSVNYQFLPEEVFVQPVLGQALLLATMVGWVVVWRRRWAARAYLSHRDVEEDGLVPAIAGPVARRRPSPQACEAELLDPAERETFVAIALTMMESNLIGVAFARSLHYQFYTWFFFTVPFVMYYTRFPKLARLAAFGLIRQGFERYPPTPSSSMMLQGGFFLALVGVLFFGRPLDEATEAAVDTTKKINQE